MKLVDRYLIRGFLKPFTASVVIFFILVILGRFFDKMGIFTDYHAAWKDIVVFLLFGFPLWLNMVLPVATLLAVLFALGQHQQQGEMTALRGAGIATWRLFAPYLGIGAVLTAVSLVGALTFLPAINYKARTVYRVKIKHEKIGTYRQDNIVATGRNNRRFTIGWLDAEHNTMKEVVMDTFDRAGHPRETVSAARAVYQRGQWVFYNGKRLVYDSAQSGLFRETNFKEEAVVLDETPADFALQEKDPEDMTSAEILRRIRRLRALGVPVRKEEMALHLKIALAFAHLVVIALAIPFALGSSHKGRLQTFGYALFVAFMYWGTASVCRSFGEQGHLPAWLAAWTANLLFGGLAGVLLWRVR